jgi:hypothetical protein
MRVLLRVLRVVLPPLRVRVARVHAAEGGSAAEKGAEKVLRVDIGREWGRERGRGPMPARATPQPGCAVLGAVPVERGALVRVGWKGRGGAE